MGSVFDRCKAVLAAVAAASGVLLYSADVVNVKFVQRGSAPLADELLMHNIRLRPGTAYTRTTTETFTIESDCFEISFGIVSR